MMDFEKTANDPLSTLTIRLLMQGKEVGSIIGKKGDIIKKFREDSGAKILISDGTCPERIVTITGTIQSLHRACASICTKMEEFQDQVNNNNKVVPGQRATIATKMVIPASQCGSLIGKGGVKIKEIRDATGATIQVSSDLLPSSTERVVTLVGTKDSVVRCIYQICAVLLESPPKVASIPYRPNGAYGKGLPNVACSYGGGFAPSAATASEAVSTMLSLPNCGAISTGPYSFVLPSVTPFAVFDPIQMKNGHLQQLLPAAAMSAEVGKLTSPLAGLAALNMGGISPQSMNHPTLAAARNATNGRNAQQTQEMTVSNDLIGCIIGKGGTRIAEIRQLSGAMIRISNCDEREIANRNENPIERVITMTGSAEAVMMAQYLINTSLHQQKMLLESLQQQQEPYPQQLPLGSYPAPDCSLLDVGQMQLQMPIQTQMADWLLANYASTFPAAAAPVPAALFLDPANNFDAAATAAAAAAAAATLTSLEDANASVFAFKDVNNKFSSARKIRTKFQPY